MLWGGPDAMGRTREAYLESRSSTGRHQPYLAEATGDEEARTGRRRTGPTDD